ncbi:MAG: S26 family signal peptidase [Thermoplasmata archaeon]|nr:S26 family signal peptidase [Thermoplasmata archaeon]
MPRRRRPDPEDEPEETETTVEDVEPSGPPRVRRSTTTRAPPKAWSIDGETADPSEEEADDDSPGWFHRSRRPVFFRARDAWWFEPLVALMVIIVLLAGLFAYTQNWPPLYVVESSSMQHGTNDNVGLINTGDLVLAQQVPTTSITPYVVGLQTGYKTYGEYGDVLLYHANGVLGPAPIVHRSLAYLVHNPNGSYDIPDLAGLPCGHASDRVYYVDTPTGCGTTDLRGNFTLFGIGWQSVTVNVTFADLGDHSGFLTMGDNNINSGTATGEEDQPGLSTLVEPGWIVGVARGMVPWVGSLKLLLSGDANEVPSQSWQFLGISIIALFGIGALIHYGLRAEGVEDDRRRALEEEEAAEERSHPSRWGALRGWISRADESEEPDEEAESAEDRLPPRRPRKPAHTLSGGGRPRPSVRRGDAHRAPKRAKRSSRSSKDDDEDDDSSGL